MKKHIRIIVRVFSLCLSLFCFFLHFLGADVVRFRFIPTSISTNTKEKYERFSVIHRHRTYSGCIRKELIADEIKFTFPSWARKPMVFWKTGSLKLAVATTVVSCFIRGLWSLHFLPHLLAAIIGNTYHGICFWALWKEHMITIKTFKSCMPYRRR